MTNQCTNGKLKRQCEICERDERIKELEHKFSTMNVNPDMVAGEHAAKAAKLDYYLKQWIDLPVDQGDTRFALREEVRKLQVENAELKAKSAGKQWQPIETAPKQKGFKILMYAGVEDWPVFVGEWDGYYWSYEEGSICTTATHWMPLPEPPRKESE